MEQTTETTTTNDKHICAHGTDSHCCNCAGCDVGSKSHHSMRRWIALVIGVLLAFFVGMKLGEMKGLMHEGRMVGDWREQR